MEPTQDIRITVDPVESIACSRCAQTVSVAGMDPFSPVTCPACGTQQVVPARLGPFLLLNLINTGGMGCVYLARDEGLGRLVAIKVMLSSLGEEPSSLESFKREAQAAARLNHPNIAQIHSFGQEHGQPYIVMELVSGKRFDKLIADSTPLDQGFVLRVGMEIAEGLKAADEIGLVHGDIKPENILLDEKMKAKLVDFGIATFEAERQMTQGVWGTPYYIAPEKVRRQKVDARADIYSLGATLYHAITGKPPFDGPTPADVVKARLDNEAPPLSQLRPDVSPRLEGIVARMLQSQPSLRYPTYASLLGDMREALHELKVSPDAPLSLRTKRVMLKKRGGSPSEKSAPQPQEASAKSPGGRLTIRKGVVGRITPETSEEPAEAFPRKPSRGSGKKIAGIVLVVVLGVFLSVLIAVWRQYRGKIEAAEMEQRRLKVELQQELDKVPPLLKQVQSLSVEIVMQSVSIRPSVEAAESMASAVFGEALTTLIPTNVPPSAPPPDPASANKEGRIREELRQTLGSVSRDAAEFARRVQYARQIVGAAEEDAKGATGLPTLELASEYVAVMGEYLAAVSPLKGEMHAQAQAIDTALRSARAQKSDLDRILEERKIEEEKQRQEEARRRQNEADLAAVEAMEAACKPYVLAMSFSQARSRVEKEAASLETPAAREKAKNLADRYKLLADWKDFLIQSITKAPYRWGWEGREDILAANEEGIRTRTGPVLWTTLQDRQIIRIVEHYLPLTMMASVRSRQFLASAVWFAESGKAQISERYLARSTELLPSAQREAERLMPKVEAPPVENPQSPPAESPPKTPSE